MKQQSLHKYFSFKTNSLPPGLSFLNLPYNVRHPLQLLYVSRAISDEVLAIFCLESKFVIRRSPYNGLLALEKLNPKVIVHLTFLSI